MRKWRVGIAALFLTAGCAAAGRVNSAAEKAQDPVEVITVTWRSPWPGVYFEDKQPPDLFTRKLPVTVVLIPSWSGWNPDSRCRIDIEDFAPRVVRNLMNRGVDASLWDPAPLILAVFVSTIDAPRRTSDIPEFCTMTIWTTLVADSKQRVAWAPEKEFTADIEFFEHSVVFRAQPEQMRAEFEKVIDRDLDWIEPLLLGKGSRP